MTRNCLKSSHSCRQIGVVVIIIAHELPNDPGLPLHISSQFGFLDFEEIIKRAIGFHDGEHRIGIHGSLQVLLLPIEIEPMAQNETF